MTPPAVIRLDLGNDSYDIVVKRGLLAEVPGRIRQLTGSARFGLIADSALADSWLPKLREAAQSCDITIDAVIFPHGEDNKTIQQAESLYTYFLERRIDRHYPIVALGGGVVSDTAGFVAATLLRGLPFAVVPTTLLSMVDASVGGKTGVNHPLGKNLIGAFHQPRAVLIDPDVLATLPKRELIGGLAECIKHDIIRDADGFSRLESSIAKLVAADLDSLAELVAHNVAIKAAVVAADPFEKGERAHLNFGHTFGHAIETVSEYSYSHGESVALGMVAATRLARKLGMIDGSAETRIVALIQKAGLPVGNMKLPVKAVTDAMAFDKKARAGLVRFVLPTRIGQVIVRDDVPLDLAARAIESLAAPIETIEFPGGRVPLRDWLQLSLTDGIGQILTARLVEAAGSVTAACAADRALLEQINGIGPQRAHQIESALRDAAVRVDDELARCQAASVSLICLDDPNYPTTLRAIPDPPVVLYIRGDLQPRDLNAIAIVGSRRCSHYGREQAERFAALLAGAGLTVISGGARGVDSAAHRGAIAQTLGRTIAVLGSGVDVAYPPENEKFFHQIAEHGAVISEFPMNTPPLKENFPRRNRVVSGLSRGVLVIEADTRSGALITARVAASDHGRPVFALPGRVDNAMSAGAHELIRDGATLVTCLDHILEGLGPLPDIASQPTDQIAAAIGKGDLFSHVGGPTTHDSGDSPEIPDSRLITATARQKSILAEISHDPTQLDDIVTATDLAAEIVMQELTLMTLRGMVKRVDGQHYVRRR